MRYRAEKCGTAYIEADSEEEARIKADELPVDKWDWEPADIDED